MPLINRLVRPGYKKGIVITENGATLVPPAEWRFLPAGNGPLTRLVKQRCKTWQVQIQKGRRTISQGVWAHEDHILAAKTELAAKRAAPDYEKRRAADLRRRKEKHDKYVRDFYCATIDYLAFHQIYTEEMQKIAQAVTELATPVGSGTVARTIRIPLNDRVQAAVIAWFRHQTTSYDRIHVAPVRGNRRKVRRAFAEQSLKLLGKYRSGEMIGVDCPLQKALRTLDKDPVK